jgi:hypothetical protein
MQNGARSLFPILEPSWADVNVGGFTVGFVIQVLQVDREPLSGVGPAIFASPSTRARR